MSEDHGTSEAGMPQRASRYDEMIAHGVAQLDMGDASALADLCSLAVKEAPDRPEAYALLGLLSYILDDVGRAIELLTKAHEMDPDISEIAELLGNAHTRAGNLRDGVFFAKVAMTGESSPLLAPIDVAGLKDFAASLDAAEEKTYLDDARRALRERRYEDAINACERELRLRDGSVDLFLTLAEAMFGLGQMQQAVDACHAAIHLDPERAEPELMLARVLIRMGQATRAMSLLDTAVSKSTWNEQFVTEAAAVAARIAPLDGLPSAKMSTSSTQQRRPSTDLDEREFYRVGYLTDVASGIDEMRVLESALNGHNREKVVISVYSADVPGDPTPERLASLSGRWTNIAELADEAVIEQISNEDIDFLIDLTLRDDGQRPGVLAAKPARHIIGVFGPKSGFLGAGHDRVVVDENCASEDDREIVASGPLLSIDPVTMPKVGGNSPFEDRGYITFGSTIDLQMITPQVAATFAAVLREVPESRLLLGGRDVVPNEVENRVLEHFADAGVINRVDVEPLEQDADPTLVVKRIRFMVSIDICLESFPVHDPMPAIDALWSGVPVVAMNGRTIDGMSTPSVLSSVGLTDNVANDRDAYVAAAARIANEAMKEGYRSTSIERLQGLPIFSKRGMAQTLESVFEELIPLN